MAWRGNRKAFVEECFRDEISNIYAEEIDNELFDTRESADKSFAKFVLTKKQNMVDYADAFIRYMRTTQLITFENKTYRVVISSSKIQDVDFILQETDRKPTLFNTEQDFKKYLFSDDNIYLFNDNKERLFDKLKRLNASFDEKSLSIDKLKDLLEEVEERIKIEKIKETSIQLKGYKEFDDIIETFEKIKNKKVPDAPLYLEWNVWRSMVMINYAISVDGNFIIDTDGVPLSNAAGNKPDIEIEYSTFKMTVEVTLSSGNTQFNMEGESVARHFGNVQKNTTKPVFCFFIATKISEGALAHFFNLNRFNTKAYGGKTRIVPMNISHFIQFITIAKSKNFSDSGKLHKYLEKMILENQRVEDEEVWFKNIEKSVSSWI
jgi:hypothetical protein